MKRSTAVIGMMMLVLVPFACSTDYRLTPDYGYGAPVDYGEKIHPGLDYALVVGTPIIACSDGRVSLLVPNHR